jgi:uncharacterized protein
MSRPTGTGPPPRTPKGWPGDDPTLPDDLSDLGRHRTRPSRPTSRHPRVREEERPPPYPDTPGPQAERAEPVGRTDVADGTAPAGRVLVVIVAALVLAMLVNADAIVARAERRAPGPGRDRALAVWHPVQDVSHALQLHRVRQFADWVTGNDDGDGSPVPEPAPETASLPGRGRLPRPGGDLPDEVSPPTTAGPARLRTPTAEHPLRLWVGGDSMSEAFGHALVADAQATGVVAPALHYEMASGLTRPDYYNWPDALTADLEATDPEVVVAVFGVNDAQGIVLPDGTPIPEVSDPRWSVEYRRRVGEVMDQLRDEHRLVLWVIQPPMRDPGFDGRIDVVNQAITAEAASRPWIVLVDPAPIVGDPNGAYIDDGRRGDGIHLTPEGGEKLAAHVLDLLGQRADLTGGAVS